VKKKGLWVAFVELEKAFDQVPCGVAEMEKDYGGERTKSKLL